MKIHCPKLFVCWCDETLKFWNITGGKFTTELRTKCFPGCCWCCCWCSWWCRWRWVWRRGMQKHWSRSEEDIQHLPICLPRENYWSLWWQSSLRSWMPEAKIPTEGVLAWLRSKPSLRCGTSTGFDCVNCWQSGKEKVNGDLRKHCTEKHDNR